MGIVLVVLTHLLIASNTTEITLQFYDSENFEPVIRCHILKNRQVVGISDDKGEIKLSLSVGDTLTIRSVGFRTFTMVVSENDLKLDKLIVFLDIKRMVLDEVTVRDFPAEDELKKMILNHRVSEDENKSIAAINIKNVWVSGLYSVPPKLGAYENYKNYTKGPQPVVFWSTGNKGLIKSLKNLSHSPANQPVFRSQPGNFDLGFERWEIKNSADSLKNTSMEKTPDN